MKKSKGDSKLIFILFLVVIILVIVAVIKYAPIKNTGNFQSLLDNFDETGQVPGKIHIGDFVQYTPIGLTSYELSSENSGYSETVNIQRDDSLKWQVLGLSRNKSQIMLISDKQTSGDSIHLKGINGYNNAVYLLNDMCNKLYGNYNFGYARSINIEDIQSNMSSIWNYSDYNDGFVKYGEAVTYTGYDNIIYPNILKQELEQVIDSKIGTSIDINTQTDIITGSSSAINNITLKHTFWERNIYENNFTNDIYYNLFINRDTPYDGYFLASRCINISQSFPQYCVSRIDSDKVSADPLYQPSNEIDSVAHLRPVIMLNSSVEVDLNNKSGTQDNPWIIKCD